MYVQANLLIIISRFFKSKYICPKVIPLSGIYCNIPITKKQANDNNKKITKTIITNNHNKQSLF